MGYTTSTVHGIDVPNSAEANNVPEDLGKIVDVLETGSLVKRLTSTAIAALTNAQKPAGLVVYNTTTNKLQISNGSTFADVDASSLPLAGGTMTGDITFSASKTVKGLRAAAANGEAVRYDEYNALGTWQTWTSPQLKQSSALTLNSGSSRARYMQIGKLVIAHATLVLSSNGTAGQTITLDLPVTAAAAGAGGGPFYHFASTVASGYAYLDTTTVVKFLADGDNKQYQATLASTNAFVTTLTYEAA